MCVTKEVNFVLDLVNNFYLVRDNDSWKGIYHTSNFLCQFQLTVPSVFFSWFNGLQGFLKRERATTGSTECFTWKSRVKCYGTETVHFWLHFVKAKMCLNDCWLCQFSKVHYFLAIYYNCWKNLVYHLSIDVQAYNCLI